MHESVLLFSDDYITVSSCKGSARSGSYILVDMKKIGRPCTCTVNSLFVGDLLVTSFQVTVPVFPCNTRVLLNNTISLKCGGGESISFQVNVSDTVIVKAETMEMNITGSFYECIGISEKGKCFRISVY